MVKIEGGDLLANAQSGDIASLDEYFPGLDDFIADLMLMGQIGNRSGIESKFPLVEATAINVEYLNTTLLAGKSCIAEAVVDAYQGSRSIRFRAALLERIIKPEDREIFQMTPPDAYDAIRGRAKRLREQGVGFAERFHQYRGLFVPHTSYGLRMATVIDGVGYVFECLSSPNKKVKIEEWLESGDYGFHYKGPHSESWQDKFNNAAGII